MLFSFAFEPSRICFEPCACVSGRIASLIGGDLHGLRWLLA